MSDISDQIVYRLEDMKGSFTFNRMELAGSLGDLGTLLPLSLGLILINHLNPIGVFYGVALYYLISGLYFRVTSPVEPMKVISAYAIASGISASTISAASLMIFGILLVIGATGLIDLINRYIHRSVVRGVQLSTGLLLLTKGVDLILGNSKLQQIENSAEPYLSTQSLVGVPIGIVLALILGFIALLLLNNRKVPAALVVVGVGICVGFLFGGGQRWQGVDLGFNLPEILPYGMPSADEWGLALVFLVIPQIPMTIGNAVIANADLSQSYFGKHSNRVTRKSLCLSMALANFGSFIIGGMPMCHGAGGLASRYRFGARTGGSNLIIGTIFLLFVMVFGSQVLFVIKLLPLSILGVLLLFAGLQLGTTIVDVDAREELFVVILIGGVSLASNLAIGFLLGIAVSTIMKMKKISL